MDYPTGNFNTRFDYTGVCECNAVIECSATLAECKRDAKKHITENHKGKKPTDPCGKWVIIDQFDNAEDSDGLTGKSWYV